MCDKFSLCNFFENIFHFYNLNFMVLFFNNIYFIEFQHFDSVEIFFTLIVENFTIFKGHFMDTQRKQRGRPRSKFTDTGGATMQSLDRALGVLTNLSRYGHTALTDLAQGLGIPVATTHRILATLQKNGFVSFDEADQTWSIGIEAYRTGSAFLRRNNLFDVSRPILRTLMETTGETANLAVPDGFEVVFIGQVETSQPIRAFFNPGVRTSMHASGVGKAILATWDAAFLSRMVAAHGLASYTNATITSPAALDGALEKIRRVGWSFDAEERYGGMSCIGAAIYNARSEAIAGISVSGPSTRFSPDAASLFGQSVKQAANQITAQIGGIQPARQD